MNQKTKLIKQAIIYSDFGNIIREINDVEIVFIYTGYIVAFVEEKNSIEPLPFKDNLVCETSCLFIYKRSRIKEEHHDEKEKRPYDYIVKFYDAKGNEITEINNCRGLESYAGFTVMYTKDFEYTTNMPVIAEIQN